MYNRTDLYKGAMPITYRKHRFKSRLEATWAIFFDEYKLEWQYESQAGESYIVDFYLPKAFLHGNPVQGIFVETKSKYAWGNHTERNNIIKKAVSIIKKHGNHPYIVVLDQPGFVGEWPKENPMYEISVNENGEGKVTVLPYFTLYKTGNIYKFTSLKHISEKLTPKAIEDHDKAFNAFQVHYDRLKSGEVRNHILDAFEAEWTPERREKVYFAEEVDQFVREYYKDFISDYWNWETFISAMQIERWKPQYLQDGNNYSKNETDEEYLLWNDNVIIDNEGIFEISNTLSSAERALKKFTELKRTLPPKTVIETPSTLPSLRRTVEALEYKEYSLRFSPENLPYR